MSQLIQAVLNSDEKTDLRQFASEIHNQPQRYLLRNDILSVFDTFCQKYQKPPEFQLSSCLQKLIYYTQELLLEDENLYFIIRPKIASEETYRLDPRELVYEQVGVAELLDLRDRFVGHYHPQEGDLLEIDFRPFYDYSPVIRDPKNIGRGVQ
ncbi:MAG: sucrose synthase, partial [Acaryochloridaceae cyanobacterium CSU_3_4]|nr:sucrose synthase [Acaryochloridaceae cyanobacterium CSU_3_4]